jgi:hypothetical protein
VTEATFIPEPFGPLYPNLGAGVAKFRRLATKAGSVRDMAKADRHAYADAIEKAIRAKHRTLHMKPNPPTTPGWYTSPSITRLFRFEEPPHGLFGEPGWKGDKYDKWQKRCEAVYAAAMEEKRTLPAPPY